MERLGNKCRCCEIDDLTLLSIDHIHGGGHQESLTARGKNFIKKVYYMPLEDLLAKFQCLCFNCNYTKGFWNCCPHKLNNDIDLPILEGNRGIKQTHLSDEEHKSRHLQLRQVNRLKIRLEMILAYGGECVNCKINHPLFLTLDHIKNNGSLDVAGIDFYQQLKKLGYPGKDTQLQLLCHNCNAFKEYQNNRNNKNEIISPVKEIYLPQPYSISEEEDEQLWMKARLLFCQLLASRS